MSARKISMRKLKEVLRLTLQAKLPYKQISSALALSKGVISKYARLASASGLDWPVIAQLDEQALERELLGSPGGPAAFAPARLWPDSCGMLAPRRF